ncbi:hypothetical protein [Glycomyces buryatensis]|uniref:Uncharacterized protein n=1 Tax=Glycomyces buryatensis TaxID=2570927 RepID=A0A4S8QGN1_9ACTN|nr:hypothetical protein [Glycomyces buryatensis]THV40529.1 hypothetical protein FAB82_14765 [Glycomyces buryatensis]
MSSKYRDLLRAQTLRERDKSEQLSEGFTPEDRREYYFLTMAFFASIVGTRLGDHPKRADIDSLVSELRYDYRKAGTAINYLHIEALLRALYGEEHLMDDIGFEDQVKAYLPVVIKIVAQNDEVREKLDAYLTDAENVAASWRQGG